MGSAHHVASIDDQSRIPLAPLALDLTDRNVRAETAMRAHNVREIRVRAVTATVPIRRVPLGTGIPLPGRLVGMGLRLIVLVATVTTVPAIRVVTAIRLPDLHVPAAIGPILRAPLVMEILDRPDSVATAHILLDPLATAIRVHVATATTAPAFPAVTAIPARHEPVAVTAPTVLVRVATERALTVLAPTVRIGRVPIVRVQIALTATSREESGSQMGESVARFARR
jgi:hypothetical protein